jgi:serine/threonine-protein kinase
MTPVREGDLLAGKYRIERVLGVGGMGVVVAARHEQLGQLVAIKFVREDALGNEDAIERFLREARSAVRLKSDHVARVIDVGKLDSGAPYMVM